jgi:DNA replication protein DnaC
MKVDRHEKEYECTHIYHQADSRAGAKIVESVGDAQTTTFLSYGQSGTGKSWILGTALDSELDSTVISSLLDIITYPI